MAQVLLVEDDASIRTALTRALRELGHGVTAVSSGMQALSAAVEQKPDVVLLDLGLPDVDGADVLSMLRSVSEIPVIVAKRKASKINETHANGATGIYDGHPGAGGAGRTPGNPGSRLLGEDKMS